MDGARFANAVASLGLSPAEVSWRAGVDVLCFGGTKMGLPVGEAVVFFDRKLSDDFAYRCKQAGQLASKMRFLSAPWLGILENGAWLRHAAHANAMARRLAAGLAEGTGLPALFPVQANGVFVRLPAVSRPACARAAGCSTTSSRPAARVSCVAGIPRRRPSIACSPTSASWPRNPLEHLAFCPLCGAGLEMRAVGGLPRLHCHADCGFVHWDNPAPVLAALVEYREHIVLARNHAWAAGAFGLDHRFSRA
jgi:hypothetical protein